MLLQSGMPQESLQGITGLCCNFRRKKKKSRLLLSSGYYSGEVTDFRDPSFGGGNKDSLQRSEAMTSSLSFLPEHSHISAGASKDWFSNHHHKLSPWTVILSPQTTLKFVCFHVCIRKSSRHR